MTAEFATKLRLTAAVLGCDSHKALCARFRAVNPKTHFEIERAHKWLQGRATPRNREVFDDWLKLLGVERSSDWLMECSVEAFLEAVSRHHRVEAATLRRRASLWESAAADDSRDPVQSPHAYLCGSFACYSWSWSPYHRGQIVRGTMTIVPAAKRTSLVGRYNETMQGTGTVVRFAGDVSLTGRTLSLHLRGPGQDPLFCCLFLPGPPASVLCGMLSGASYIGNIPQPSATPFIAVRVPEDPEPSNGYIKPVPGALAADLAALGLPMAAAADVDARMHDLLRHDGAAGSWQVSDSGQVNLTTALDRPYLFGK